MDWAQILGTFGAPPLALMVVALLTERARLLKVIETKELALKANDDSNQERLDKTADQLLKLAQSLTDSGTH